MTALLEIDGLEVTLGGRVRLVEGVSLTVAAGEALGLVGESGSGKSITAYAVAGLFPSPEIAITGGSIRLDGRELRGLPRQAMRAVRGACVGMVFQDPTGFLDPLMPVGRQVAEVAAAHGDPAPRTRAAELLHLMELPEPEAIARKFPHELSGGMRQRVTIAAALAGRPALLIADEPTTALDVTVQGGILALLDRLRAELGLALLLITHDMGVIAQHCQRVAVMYAGRVVETATVASVFAAPVHPYTTGLLRSARALDRGELFAIPGQVPQATAFPAGCRFHPRCPIMRPGRCTSVMPGPMPRAGGGSQACWHAGDGDLDKASADKASSDKASSGDGSEPAGSSSMSLRVAAERDPLIAAVDVTRIFTSRRVFDRTGNIAVNRVTLAIPPGETVALVGESGSGKSTLGRLLLGLDTPGAGHVAYRGTPLPLLDRTGRRAFRREVQAVFQDTGAALNPSHRIVDSVMLPLRYNLGQTAGRARDEAATLLDRVGLPAATFAHRLPRALSGGQRQRVGIARALACRPRFIVADEPVSALDVSLRAQVIALLRELCRDEGLACLFITHDLGVARVIAQRVAVMYRGDLVELGPASSVLAAPRHPYTQALLASIPVADPAVRPSARIAAPPLREMDAGCRFRTRCPLAAPSCAEAPPWRSTPDGHGALCHFAEAEKQAAP